MTPGQSSVDSLPGLDAGLSLGERRRAVERRRRRWWLRVWSVVGVLVVVGGVLHVRARAAHEAVSQLVRQEARAGDLPIPAVVWPRGLPDHGEWADDPWVQALREFSLVNAAAFNSGRVEGRADLALLATPDGVDYLQGDLEGWRLQGREFGTVPVYPGPVPFEVLDVVPNEDGDGAEVFVCTFIGLSWDEGDSPDEVMGNTEGYRMVWEMVRGEDGHIRYVSVHEDYRASPAKRDCTISDVHYGLFDPQPVRLADLPTDVWTEPAGVDSGLGLEDIEDAEDLEEYLDELTGDYDELRDLAEQAVGR